jgi:(1->4)-alpha-D-glucan 1-alpha-D-glucosylmutase
MTEKESPNATPHHIPLSTYRLQMHHQFGFNDAARLLPYLSSLGVGDCYTSPLLKARAGSTHGYDITDHHQLNPELGSDTDYENFSSTLHRLGMGHLLDIVPNHMGIDPMQNAWWRDVLENGPSSPYARYFDIDWHPLKPELHNKVLLPILGDQYGAVLERGELHLVFEEGAIVLRYGELNLPLNPRRTPDVLKINLEALQTEILGRPELREFLSILTELSNLPALAEQDPDKIEERQREKEVARERLSKLFKSSGPIRRHLVDCVHAFNGQPGKPETFNALHELLEAQAYRLAYWKTASHEINYRRFFDINQLAGLRMERPAVFEATHEKLFTLIQAGKVNGLRLDHPDGLYDPAGYFEALQKNVGPLYVVAEKILSAGESLRKSWAVHGTSGYDFLNLVNHLLIDSTQGPTLLKIYQRFTNREVDSQAEMYQSKKLIMSTSMASELNVLAHLLNQISETSRLWRDFTLESLRDGLREVVACFPVYRTYISASAPSPSDELIITKAVARAKNINPAVEASIFDFIRTMLVPQPAAGLAAEDYERRLEFAMKFQQYTAPVQAKGVEDTAFYRHNVLVSINEVGGDLDRFGISIADFHQANTERQRDWPYALLATTTHDTKRGEDSRARIDVLSEIPEEWEQAVTQWAAVNHSHKTLIEGRLYPDANDEYLIYQTLVGAWLPGSSPTELSPFLARMKDYAIKATREAKRYTSWIRPNEDYEKATLDFLDKCLRDAKPGGFMSLFESFIQRVSAQGMMNSLTQLALKMAVPGIPDFYQGTELWDWSLVDPDNRRAIDFDNCLHHLKELEPLFHSEQETVSAAGSRPASSKSGSSVAIESRPDRQTSLQKLLTQWHDGRIKLFLTALGLRYRKLHPDLFLKGSYSPLKILGDQAEHAVAFAREYGEEKIVVVVPRLLARFKSTARLWESLQVQLPESWSVDQGLNVFTEEIVTAQKGHLSLAAVFASLPVAWIKF